MGVPGGKMRLVFSGNCTLVIGKTAGVSSERKVAIYWEKDEACVLGIFQVCI